MLTIVFPLGHNLSSSFQRSLIFVFFECLVVVDDTLDEGLLKICRSVVSVRPARIQAAQLTPMNDPRSLRRLCPISDSPLPHLICPRREEAAEVKHLPHGRDHLGQGRFCTKLFTFLRCFRFSLETCEALLESDGQWQYRIAWRVLLDPFGNLRKVLVLLSDVIFFAKIDKVNDRFGAEEEERIYRFDLFHHSLVLPPRAKYSSIA